MEMVGSNKTIQTDNKPQCGFQVHDHEVLSTRFHLTAALYRPLQLWVLVTDRNGAIRDVKDTSD